MSLLLSLGQGLFGWTLKTSVCAGILILLIFVAQKLAGKWLAPRWRYTLSLLVLVRLWLPLAPASPLSWENLLPLPAGFPRSPAAGSPAPGGVAQSSHRDDAAKFRRPLPERRASITNSDILCLIWISGCCGLMGLAAWRYQRWCRWTRKGETISETRLLALLDNACGAMGVRQPVVAVAVSPGAGPAVFGVRRARLLLPRNILDRLSDAELRLVLLHEMAHVRRKDALLNTLLMATQFLHWFNPLVWLALHRIRADRELVCDEMVMRRLRPEERAGYGRLLLKLINEFPTGARLLPGTAAVVGNQQEMKRRIIMIKNHGQNGLAGCVLAIVAAVVMGCATFTRAQSSPPETAETAKLANNLVGTWMQVGEAGKAPEVLLDSRTGTWIKVGEPGKGKAGKPPAAFPIKFITGTRWDLTTADPKTGVTLFHHGGTYTLKGDEYRETVEYANENTAYLIKRTNKFKIKIEGDTLTLLGIGNPWNEVWKRVK